VKHVVSFQDLDKLPVKSCVFSLVLELEELLIAAMLACPSAFLSHLPSGRRKKAEHLCRQKHEGRVSPEWLLSCTTFIDKKTMALGHGAFRARLPFESRSKAGSFFKRVEDVRNQIARGESMLSELSTPGEFDDLVRAISGTVAALRRDVPVWLQTCREEIRASEGLSVNVAPPI